MTNFSYTASGTLYLGGCSSYRLAEYLPYRFAIGSIVFDKQKAAKGKYEQVVIKKVRFPNKLNPLYTDTFNAIWSEGDLVSYSDAKALVDAYFELRDVMMKEIALKCSRKCR